MMRLVYSSLVALMAIALAGSPAGAKLLISREDALVKIFGETAVTQSKTLYLTEEEKAELEQTARAKIKRRRVTYYQITAGDSLAGLVFVDKHVVRSLSETVLIAIDAKGNTLAVEILAWYEPDDYMPSSRWLEQAEGQQEIQEMRVGEGMPHIAGATLSTQALTAALRRALAIGNWILFQTERD